MARAKASDFVEGRMKGGSVSRGHFEIVRWWAFKEEIFQAWIPKIRISTQRGTKPGTASGWCRLQTIKRSGIVIGNFLYDRLWDISRVSALLEPADKAHLLSGIA